MKEIRFRFENGKIIFEIGQENYFMSAENLLDILDRQKAVDTFESLKPEVKFRDQNRLEIAVMYRFLKDRGVAEAEISEKLGFPKAEDLADWIATGYAERIKAEKEDDFAALYRGLDEYKTESVLKSF